ncbi:MAG: fused MFS/spermidine synthase [Hyphomicrobium sp.]|nr:fused MFS/spermidine synthase [Hyphomicrobium sp.]
MPAGGAMDEAVAPRAAMQTRQGNAGVLALFAATAFLSAFLLFAIQPMFAKMVLPVLGGSSSVWAVALLFFQAALLIGYGYAHLLMRHVPATSTGFVHLAIALVALITLPVGLPEGWREPPGDPYLWQLGLFGVAVGLPFVAVAANAPLLQAWFARSGHPHAKDPYFLYGASNLGSLIALLGYPFVLEPAFGLTALSRYWALLYIVLVVAIGACFALVRRRASAAPVSEQAAEAVPDATPTWRDRLAWCGLALLPAALLTAFTTHIATDIASAPLLWVLPLALYLLTFVLAFQTRLPLPMWLLLPLQLAAVIFALLELAQVKHDKWVLTSGAGVAAFFLAALVAHRTLYLARPRARYLTEFYFWMSFGGVLGGLFAALIAPRLFSEVFEYPLLIALSLACRPGVFGQPAASTKNELIWIFGIFAAGLLAIWQGPLLAARYGYSFGEWGTTPVIALVFAVAAVALWGHGARQLTAALMMFAAVVMLPSAVKRGQAQRSYYGVYRVSLSEGDDFNVLTHGTTLHGAQRLRGLDGKLISDVTPGTYYYPGSPMAEAVKITQARLDAEGELGRFGVIGLGAGSLSCYSRKHEAWRFFEIDPIVVDIAAKSNHFTFLANCQPKLDVVIGDARLTLAKEEDSSFDLIIVDAFTSDAVPVHLMTAEALQLYAKKLTDHGVVVLHISNRYLDLDSVLGATLPLVPELKGLIVSDDKADGSYAQNTSTIAVFAKDTLALDAYRALEGAQDFHAGGVSPWTDDASDILGPFLSQWRRS